MEGLRLEPVQLEGLQALIQEVELYQEISLGLGGLIICNLVNFDSLCQTEKRG